MIAIIIVVIVIIIDLPPPPNVAVPPDRQLGMHFRYHRFADRGLRHKKLAVPPSPPGTSRGTTARPSSSP